VKATCAAVCIQLNLMSIFYYFQQHKFCGQGNVLTEEGTCSRKSKCNNCMLISHVVDNN